MPITYGEFRKLVAPYAGRAGTCYDNEKNDRFAKQVMESLLFSGSSAGVRKVEVLACDGRIVLPHEVETPIKVKVGSRVANVWSRWLTYHSHYESFDGCPPAEDILEEDGSLSPLAYPLPPGGSVVGIMGTCNEDEDARVIVAGEDTTGREVYTVFEGKRVVGEEFRIQKLNARWGKVLFGKITGLIKPKTNGYVTLFAMDPASGTIRRFLGDYSPSEERPMFRVWKIHQRHGCTGVMRISMLCRVKLKDNYADNELTLFDNTLAIQMAAQRIQSEVNNDIQTANYKRQAVTELLESEAGYKKTPNAPIDVFFPLSGGAIKNVIR